MKMLTHRTPAGTASPFDLETVKNHLRVDFADDDEAIERIAWTAAREIEQFAQIALLNQMIRVVIVMPNQKPGLNLPIGPVDDAPDPTVMIDGEDFTDFMFFGGNRPYLFWGDSLRKLNPQQVVIQYQAGFGAAAADIPTDLAQALMDQAALHYDGRSPMDSKSLTTSPHMARIGARYRGVQI